MMKYRTFLGSIWFLALLAAGTFPRAEGFGATLAVPGTGPAR